MLHAIKATLADKSNIASGEGGKNEQGQGEMCPGNSRKVEGLNTAVAH